jgi:hypothetical protein
LKLIFHLKVLIFSVIIAYIDTFFPGGGKPKVILTAQASLHTSEVIVDKLEEWR